MEVRLITSILMIMTAIYIGTNPNSIKLTIAVVFLILVMAININCDKE